MDKSKGWPLDHGARGLEGRWMRLTLFPSWSKLAASHPGDQMLAMRGQVTLCFECWV